MPWLEKTVKRKWMRNQQKAAPCLHFKCSKKGQRTSCHTVNIHIYIFKKLGEREIFFFGEEKERIFKSYILHFDGIFAFVQVCPIPVILLPFVHQLNSRNANSTFSRTVVEVLIRSLLSFIHTLHTVLLSALPILTHFSKQHFRFAFLLDNIRFINVMKICKWQKSNDEKDVFFFLWFFVVKLKLSQIS